MRYKKILERIGARDGLRSFVRGVESHAGEGKDNGYIAEPGAICGVRTMCDCGCELVFRDGGSAAERKPAAD